MLLEPFMETLPPKVRVVSNTKSALKSAPVFGEFMNSDFTSSKFLDVIVAIERTTLLVSSKYWFACAEVGCAEEIRFSPTLKLPDTVINSNLLSEVTPLKRKPVAPDVAPVIFAPWVTCAVVPGLPVPPVRVMVVNIRTSNSPMLKIASESAALDNLSFVVLPEECSNTRALATPTCPELLTDPLLAFFKECNSTVLWGSATSPEINGDRSGIPNTSVIFVKLPTSTFVIAESKLSVVLGFGKSRYVGITVSIS